jgi:hypothetical protein
MTISQKVLQGILKQRQKIETLTKSLAVAEDAVFQSLKGGATVQNGMLAASIKVLERRSPAWKPVLIREIDARDGEGAGERLAARVLAATRPDTHERLVVELAAPTKKLRKAG